MSKVGSNSAVLTELHARLEQLRLDRMRLDGEIAGTQRAIALLTQANEDRAKTATARKPGAVKEAVFSILKENKAGYSSAQIVSILEDAGNPQKAASVRSVLSASERQGVLEYLDGIYRIRQTREDLERLALGRTIEEVALSTRERIEKQNSRDLDDDIPF